MQRSASTLLALAALLGACSNGESNPPAPGSSPDAAAGMHAALPQAGKGAEPPPPPPVDAGPKLDAGPPPTADAMVHVMDDEDAGPWEPPDPVCVQGKWQLAPGLLLAQRVDYVADRELDLNSALGGDGTLKTVLLSSAGRACFTATDKPKCEAGLALPVSANRHLVTTAGDSVRVWAAGGAAAHLLGLIDTPAEAIWWVSAMVGTYLITCDVKVETVTAGSANIGFLLKNVYSTACGNEPNPITHSPLDLMVRPTGETFELGTSDSTGTICRMSGATPVGGMGGGGMGGF